MTERPHGIYPILYAYFDDHGALDRDAMRRQVTCCLESGAHGIAILGLITEVGALTVDERRTIIDWAAEDINGAVPLAVTLAGETPEEQISLARAAEDAGAGWLIAQPPRATKPDEPELMRFFGRIMDSAGIPVGIQNFPEVLGTGLTPDGVGQLHRQHANFTVMKGEGAVYSIRRYMDASDGGIAIFNGRGGIELPDNFRAGCAGIIPAPDCADVQIAMYEAFRAGRMDEMDALYTLTLPYVIFVMQSVGFALTYGKRQTAERMGISAPSLPRNVEVALDDFGLERLAAHAAPLGDFGQWHTPG